MIVVDMDMPKTCGTCKLSVGYTCTKWLKLYRDEMASKKAEDCPIVAQIPQKHGRLIDVGQCDRKLFYQQCGGADSLITVKSAFDMLMSLPTIIEADRGEEE